MPGAKRCRDCPSLGRWARGRCTNCERTKDTTRGTRQARGYDAEYDRTRTDYQRRMDTGETFHCWRPGCGDPIDPTRWHLGHDDTDRTVIRGPECEHCNLSAAGKRSAYIRSRA